MSLCEHSRLRWLCNTLLLPGFRDDDLLPIIVLLVCDPSGLAPRFNTHAAAAAFCHFCRPLPYPGLMLHCLYTHHWNLLSDVFGWIPQDSFRIQSILSDILSQIMLSVDRCALLSAYYFPASVINFSFSHTDSHENIILIYSYHATLLDWTVTYFELFF